jgi:2-C-methyl-D-erythritol 4-phosphate cytidylyltransferase
MQEVNENVDIILIHDAVRPFFSKNIIDDGVKLLDKYDGAIAAVPTINTIKIVKNNLIKETLLRENLYRINTPQMFNKEAILRAYAYAKENNIYGTDDSMLVEKVGGKVAVIPDSYDNIKITTKSDLIIAKEVIDGN